MFFFKLLKLAGSLINASKKIHNKIVLEGEGLSHEQVSIEREVINGIQNIVENYSRVDK